MATRPDGGRPLRAMLPLEAALLALGVAALGAAVAGMPALSPDLRVDIPPGGWRPAEQFGLYDRPAYLVERALAFAALADDAEQPRDALVPALALALGAVKAAPADAYAWTVLAGLAAASDLPDVAREALGRSRALAPHAVGLAVERLTLAAALNPIDDPAIDADLRLARAGRAADLAAAVAADPALAALVAGR